MVKCLPAMQETWVQSLGSIPGSGRSPGEGNGNPLQYSSPEQKTTKFYKAIIFNLKINYLKKKEFAKPAFSQLLRKSHLWVPHLNMESTRQNLYSTSGGWMRKSGKQERVPLCG